MKTTAVALALAVIFSISSISSAEEMKHPDLAGSWYPGSKDELESVIQAYIQKAEIEPASKKIFGIISPHAGLQFSGPVAAYGFKFAKNQNVKTAVIIGFTHRNAFDGISVYDRGSFRTPLGEAGVDVELAGRIIQQNKRIFFLPQAFQEENSVEMQIPFVQMTWPGAKIVPIAFGTQSYDDAKILADALANILADRDDCIIVASTDLSHYHPYEKANNIDEHTISLIEKMDSKRLYEEGIIAKAELCGLMSVCAVMSAAKNSHFNNVKILKYANSGDTFGSKDNVVGYLSAAIYKEDDQLSVVSSQLSDKKVSGEKPNMLNEAQRKRLLEIARESLTSFVREGKRKDFVEKDPVLNKPLGAFVTLHEAGELRGCIGNMIGQGPLYKTVADMAIEAGTGDPRFPPLSSKELDIINIEVSVLSPLKKVSSHEEVAIPGDGVLVRKGYRSGVYLPQVADETGWNKEEFLTSLCAHKAGLAPDAWKDPATEIYVFKAEIFREGKEEKDEE